MKTLLLAAAALIALPTAAMAQNSAPDGTPAFGFEPYIGVLGGYDQYNRDSEFGTSGRYGKMDGALVSGIVGANVPLGAFFVGAEGNVAKGFKDIDWEYGVKGRAGIRAGTSGLFYASAGYEWVNGKGNRGFADRSDWIYGVGMEVGPKDIGLGGLTGPAGMRLRLQVDTYDFKSARPMAGLVFHL